MMNAPLTSTAMNVVRRDQLGMVSGLLAVIMQVGGPSAWRCSAPRSNAARPSTAPSSPRR
jgi:hypothetical protein